MKKRIPFFLAAFTGAGFILCSLFLSCSAQTEKDENSFLTFSFPESSLRAATNRASGDWNLRISISGGIKMEKVYPIKAESLQKTQTFLLENLPSEISVNIDSYIYCGDLCYFKSKETKSMTLSTGINSVDIVLVRALSNGDFAVENPADIKISAKDSEGNEYSSSGQSPDLPYDSQITFSLDSDTDFDSYIWYLNGNELEGKTGKISLKFSENDYVVASDSANIKNNSLVCFFISDENRYCAEFVFTTAAN